MEKVETGLLAVGGVGGAVALAANKVLPEQAVVNLKRKRSMFRRRVQRWKFRYPRLYWFLEMMFAMANVTLYFLDVCTDVLLSLTFLNNGHYGWFSLIVTFLTLPQIVAMVGIVIFVKKEKPFGIDWETGYDTGKKAIFFLTSPVWVIAGPLVCDVMMPFYRMLQTYLPDHFVAFMCQYVATRTLSENVMESIPQMILQL